MSGLLAPREGNCLLVVCHIDEIAASIEISVEEFEGGLLVRHTYTWPFRAQAHRPEGDW